MLFIFCHYCSQKNRTNIDIVAKGKYLPNFKEFLQIGITFSLTVLAWIFFRANNMEHALNYISQIFTGIIQHPGSILLFSFWSPYKTIIFLIIVFFLIEWFGREQQFAIANIGFKWYKPIRWVLYYGIIIAIIYFAGKEQQFIYFQF